MRRAVATSLLAIALLGLTATGPLQAAGAGQNDAGRGSDAPDTRAAANDAGHPALAPGRHFGQLVATTDTDDWYKFTVPSTGDVQGRRLIEALLVTDPGSNYDLSLWRPGDTTDPVVQAPGPAGVRAVRYSADADGTWNLRVAGTTTGRYELTFRLGPENDHNASRDAPDSSQDAAAGFNLGFAPVNGVLVRANLTRADPGDLYRFQILSNTDRLVATLHYPPDANLRMALLSPSGGVPLESIENGAGFSSLFLTSPGGTDTSVWGLRVLRQGGAAGTDAPYTLHLATNIPDQPDAGTSFDAPAGLSPAIALTPGTHIGNLRATTPTDLVDAYKLPGLKAGHVLQLGVSSYTSSVFTKPLLAYTLYKPDQISVAVREVCAAAGGHTLTLPEDGDWYLHVEETGTANCQGGPSRDGRYLVSFTTWPQLDAANRDAPTPFSGAPTPPDSVLSPAWTDPFDLTDTFRVGPVPAGGVIRAAVHAAGPNLALRASVLDGNGTLIGSPVTTTGGIGKLHISVAAADTYYVRMDQVANAGQFTSGYYKFYVRSGPNEAPAPVTLLTPPDGDIGRNTVRLSWTASEEADFLRYEIHGSRTSGFTPSAATLRATVNSRTETTRELQGLDSGQQYQFLVRIVDQAALSTDSNRVTLTLKSGLFNNRAPTLASPEVTPTEGDASTLFTFRVRYTDADNDPPALRRVYIDSAPFDMTGAGTNYAAGVVYTLQTTLGPGNHQHYFEFGDGEFTARSPAVSGTHPGPTVTQQGNRPPTVTAGAQPKDGEAPLQVQFTATASDPDGDPLSYSWDFDNSDGIQSQSSAKDPQHTYNQPGRYTASVRATDAKGATSTSQVEVNVRGPSNQPPRATPRATPDSGNAPLAVQFDANATDPDGLVVRYAWDFDSTNGFQNESSHPTPTFTYVNAGSYIATVRVEDNQGASATATVNVVVRTANNAPPSVVVRAVPAQGPAPLVVDFFADVVEPDGDAYSVSWDFDLDDGVTVQATGETARHTYPSIGSYTAMAIVTDAKNATSSGTTQVTVTVPPVSQAGAVFARAEPASGRAPLRVLFSADTSRLPQAVSSYEWSFGDGSAKVLERNTEHVYQAEGSYVALLKVRDAGGRAYESSVQVDVLAKKSPGLAVAVLLATLLTVAAWGRPRQPSGP